ncbi:hypothetical protein KIW84_050468 [Lathyrus oleraceus]|uniref:Uncharacterized protein n=1 Tax=Pisum sativum TaxID=3888 RepID=A0A9D4WIL4_PEA|nr:hypothetical protein KIW84_050468 [Pisum sativum]
MSHVVQIGSNGVQSNDQEHEMPQVCTQGSLENTNLGEEVASAPAVNTPKQRFQQKEDGIFIQSWLNVLKDSIVGVDKKGDSFWKRIDEALNKHRDINYKERKLMALKGSLEASVKRTQNSASRAYSSSSNPLTPMSSEYNPSSPSLLRRPVGQKASKMKEKEKLVEMSSTPNVKYDSLKDDFKKIDLMSMFARDYARIEVKKSR